MSFTESPISARVFVFSPFSLDVTNQRLEKDGTALFLTPKAFSLLHYLIEHANRLVTKQELLDAVWEEAIVGDAVIRVSMGEVRRALGDHPDSPRYIETVHRKGYRFIAPVSTTPPVVSNNKRGEELQQLAMKDGQPASPFSQLRTDHWQLTTAFTGREAELQQLHNLLSKAANGERQVVFLSGEAGIGKTALIETFLLEVQNRKECGVRSLEEFGVQGKEESQNSQGKTQKSKIFSSQLRTPPAPSVGGHSALRTPNPRILRGQCLEHFGAGEAYMPLLDAFTVLARTAQGTTLISALRRYAPTWLLEMPGLLPGPEREQLRREVEGTTRERMLRELTEVINVIAADTPLVLVLEDLHWSDYPTLDALAALARRCATARLLVIGTYRPVDMTFTNHPLKRMKQELEAHGHCTEIALPLFDEPTVATHLQVLLTDGDPRQLGDVAKTVYQRTEGNPLFIVNLVSDLLAQGVLEVHEGHWQLSPAKRDLMLDVPSKVQHLIARQIERLDDDTQHLLEGASASGVTFVAAVAAAITGQERSWVEQRCEELAQQRHLLHVVNVTQLADGTLSSRYAFAHAMYQQVLYQRISAMRQIQFHQRMGQFAERLYGAQAKEHAAELVRHFELGREYRRAIEYAWFAALNALRRHANREAVVHLKKGLALLDHCSSLTERSELELKLYVMFGQAQMALRGYGDPEVELAYSRARELCAQQADSPALFAVLSGLWGFYLTRGKLQIAQDLAQDALQLALKLAQPGSLVDAHFQSGCTLFYRGEFVAARRHLEEGVALYQAKQPQFRTTRAVQHPGVACFAYLAWTLWFLGHPEHAWQRSHEALTLARKIAHPFSVGFALDLMATLHQSCGEIEAARERASDLVALAREQEFALWKATGSVTRGWALVRADDEEQGVLFITESMTALRAIGVEIARSYYELVLAEVQGRLGKGNEGIATLAKAQEVIRANSERFCEAELYRLKGELTLKQSRVRNSPRRRGQAEFGVKNSPESKGQESFKSQNVQSTEFEIQTSSGQIPNPKPQILPIPDSQPPAPGPHAEAEAEAYFLKAIDIAQRQQAKALELRAVVSLARLWQRQNRLGEAQKILKEIYSWFTDEAYTPELKRAKALLVALDEQQPAERVEGEVLKQPLRLTAGGATPIRRRVP